MVGFLVGILPVALGLAWLPSLRQVSPEWLAAFMALTGGLLTFLGFEALSEALDLQAALPGGLGGTGLVLLGFASTYLALSLLGRWLGRGATVSGLALATLVAVGIGLHNLGEGLRSALRSPSASSPSGRSSSSGSWCTTSPKGSGSRPRWPTDSA